MKFFTATAAAAFITLGACTPNLETASTATAADPLIGKRLVSEDTTFIFNADGTMSGESRGKAIVGTYKANAKETCSTFSAPESMTGREFCSTPMINGNTVIFNRRDGSQSPLFTIKG